MSKIYWCDNDIVSLPANGWSSTGFFTRETVSPRTGIYSYQLLTDWEASRLLGSNLTGAVCGFAYKLSTQLPPSSKTLFGFADPSTMQISVALDHLGALRVYRGKVEDGSTLIAGPSPNNLINVGSYAYIELKAFIANSGGYFSVRVNGQSIDSLTVSNIDTQNTSNAFIDRLTIRGLGQAPLNAHPCFIDDIYINDLLGTTNNDFEGDVRFYVRMVDGIADYSESTPTPNVARWQNVDDNPTPDDASTYNTLTNTNQRDLFTLEQIGITSGVIVGVVPFIRAKKADAGAAQIQTMLKSGSVEVFDTIQALSTDYVTYQGNVQRLNPETNAPFTLSDFDALKLGYKRST